MAAASDDEVYQDPNTYSNYKEISIIHSDIEWEVRFDTKQLVGSVTHTIKQLNSESTVLCLDTYDLDITRVTHWTQDLPFTLSPKVDADPKSFGRCLNIDLETVKFHDTRDESEKKNDNKPSNDTAQIKIEYSTSSSAEAIQWLDASITDGGKLPYLFTQCQPIGARTMLPCQDTCGNKFSYTATVKTPKKIENGTKDSQFIALMSAPTSNEFTVIDNDSDPTWTIHKIRQPRRIPSYLLALVIGDLAQEIVGDLKICSVVTEPVNMAAVKWEFEHMQSYLTIAQNICGPYRWSSYACLVLPSSFPYGGMENPNLTFVTPTIVAGDRSLVNVVAHEITHSWSGNLVTNESWEHFWLNEGWTKFIEEKIMQQKVTIDKEAEKLGITIEAEKFTKIKYNEISKESREYGVRFHALLAMNSNAALKESVELFGSDHEFTKLNVSLKNIDPDDCYSSVPYEKGAQFLMHIEEVIGGNDIFEPFIKKYFEKYAEQSIGFKDFQTFLIEFFEKNDTKVAELLKTKIDWNTWIHKPGMSPVNIVDTLNLRAKRLGVENVFILIEDVDNLVKKWIDMKEGGIEGKESENDDIKNGMNGWSVDQKEMFLDRMLSNIKIQLEKKETTCEILRKKLKKMNEIYKLYPKNNDNDSEQKEESGSNKKSKQNCEILFRFFLLVLECEEKELYQDVATQMLARVGRMKYVRPLYRALARKDYKLAQDSFEKYKATQYHPIAVKMVQKDLEAAKPQ